MKKQITILNTQINDYVNQKNDFGNLSKIDQTKYLGYFFTRITGQNYFSSQNIAPLFSLVGVDEPQNIRDLLNKLKDKGSLIPSNGGFAIHRNEVSRLNQEFGSLPVQKSKSSLSELRLRGMHQEVVSSSEKLFQDGHYPEAIFNAFKRVEILVKKKSNVNSLTGHPLMQKVFSANKPILRFNGLQNQTDKDEQQGMMELFAGAMLGIRNPKAHDDVVQKDPVKTLEYLAFASLLCKRLDESKISP